VRQPERFSPPINSAARLEIVAGDLLYPETYRSALQGVDTVVHLAAATGKAPSIDHFRINQEGTRLLVEHSRTAGVKRFLFVSSISVKYPDLSGYPYARSKEAAEQIVQSSGLPFCIVRPTIVIGLDSPIWTSLGQLVQSPFLLVFGDGSAQIQPIYVDDLTTCLISILHNKMLDGKIYELGGPDRRPFVAFQQEIYAAKIGRPPRMEIRLPVKPIRGMLNWFEEHIGDFLPVRSGQFSSFVYDGSIQANPLFEKHKEEMVGVSQMVMETHKAEEARKAHQQLLVEAQLFTRYLIDKEPDDYILNKYEQGHDYVLPSEVVNLSGFDAFCLRLAGLGTGWTRLVDMYCTFFFKQAALRKKLLLLLAILENSGSTYRSFQPSRERSLFISMASLIRIGLGAGLVLFVSCLFLMPFHLGFSSLRLIRGGMRA